MRFFLRQLPLALPESAVGAELQMQPEEYVKALSNRFVTSDCRAAQI